MFKSQVMIPLFLPSIISTDLLAKRSLLQWVQKVYGLWFVISGFQPVLRVSLSQAVRCRVIVIMIDGSKKRNCEGAFWTSEFACFWEAS